MSAQRQKLVLMALVAVMALVYFRAWRPPARRVPAVEAAASQEAVLAPVAPEREPQLMVSADRVAQRRHAEEISWGRDPFLRGGAEGQAGALMLSGILWDASAPIAIINGQMLHVGDELEGYRIMHITSDRVTVTDGTDTFQLQIVP